MNPRFTFEHLHGHLGETRGLAAVDADGLGQNHLTEAALAKGLPQGEPEDAHGDILNRFTLSKVRNSHRRACRTNEQWQQFVLCEMFSAQASEERRL